jgi:membrane peptidoglycan carboxypeptidase
VSSLGFDWSAISLAVSGRSWVAWLKSKRGKRIAIVAVIGAFVGLAAVMESKDSWFESLLFRAADSRINYHLADGPSNAIHYPSAGPYDWALGYARMPGILNRLEASGYRVQAQARDSQLFSLLSSSSLYPVYRQKAQAGLEIADRNGLPLYSFDRPAHVYKHYSDIPPLVVRSLLFIENRHMLDAAHPYRNPAVEWDRLSKAFVDYGLHAVDSHHQVIGGSTLATQLEKLRHSPGGRTHSAVEKLRQMTSASLAAYQEGSTTLDTQREIVRDYINSIPLAASAGYGDVEGLGDGLWAWYGTDVSRANLLLSDDEDSLDKSEMIERARVYRETLSLLLALRAPHFYLVERPKALEGQTDRYLRAMAARGIISTRLCNLALRERIQPLRVAPSEERENFVENKAPNAIRTSLLPLLGVPSTYELDRLDLTVRTTIDQPAQQSITHFIEGLANKNNAAAAGLQQYRLLEQSDPSKVLYSVTLYERAPGANLLRVQTDNLNQPLNINQDTRLELGSTAKLRTLINYLEIVSDLHREYAGKSPEALRKVSIFPDDHLTAWAVQYLATAQNRGLEPMLEAALQRKYSGSNGESFFTGGGVHHFENFESWENGSNMTVSQAFQNSVNLVFVRIMRDVVNYYRFRVPGATPAVLNTWDDPARQAYLGRFADQEGRLFESRFYQKYRDLTPDESLRTLVHGPSQLTPLRAAVIYRSVRPQAGLAEFTAFLNANLPKPAMAKVDPSQLYAKYGADKFDLADRGYLAHVHPLELWLLNYRDQHPRAQLKEILAKSATERQRVYWWLFKTGHKEAQDNRIRTLLEQDAFNEIHKAWKRQGYPFDSLVPSYATTIGVSGDTPAALADLMGILVNDGVRKPTLKIDELHFGQGTPTETIVTRKLPPSQPTISPMIAALVRKELIGVVENGTGRRAHGGIVLGGRMIPVGGKTGTGDNRVESFSAHGAVIGSKVTSRTATFVFMIGDRFYGTILAFVPGAKAASYEFTSALAVQIFKDLDPQWKALLNPPAQPPDASILASSRLASNR